MVHIQDLIENLDPCRSPFQSSVHSHLIKPLLKHPSIPTCVSSAIYCHSSCWDLSLLPWLRHQERRDRTRRKGKEEATLPLLPPSFYGDTSGAENEVLVPPVPKTSASSSLLPVGSSPVQINGIPSVPSQLPHIPASSSSTYSPSTPELILKQNDRKINIDDVPPSSSLSSSLISTSENNVARDVIEALSESEKAKGFESIKRDWEKWRDRKDLFDHVVMKNVEFIIGFINQVEDAKGRTLAALFIKRPDKVDEVLKKIKYDDDDLRYLTNYRPELAESHENFFKVIDKIKNPKNQEWAVRVGVSNLFDAKKHDSVIPLIDALESSTLSRNVKDAAIQKAFYEGAKRGIKDIVEKFHEHPAITSREYANGLM